MAWCDDWGRKCELVIQASQVSETLTDFPVTFSVANLPAEMLTLGGQYEAQADAGDLRFYSVENPATENDNRLAVEIVGFTKDATPANAEAEIYVKVPSISSTVNTSVWVFYNATGKSPATEASGYGKHDVWDANFGTVHHLSGANAVSVLDSTSSNIDFATAGNLAFNDPGMHGAATAVRTDPNQQSYLRATPGNVPADQPPITIEHVARRIGTGVRGGFIAHINNDASSGPTTGYLTQHWWNTHKFIASEANSDSYYEAESAGVYDDNVNWFHTAYRFLGVGTPRQEVFVNGVSDGTNDTGDPPGAMTGFVLGRRWNKTNDSFYGVIDEVRVSNIIRSDGWLAASSIAFKTPGTFIVAGTPQDGTCQAAGGAIAPIIRRYHTHLLGGH